MIKDLSWLNVYFHNYKVITIMGWKISIIMAEMCVMDKSIGLNQTDDQLHGQEKNVQREKVIVWREL